MILNPWPIAALATLAAAGDTAGIDQVIQLVNYGVLGIIVIGAATGFVEFKPSVSRLVRYKDRQHTQIDSLVKTYEERVIPVLVSANEMLARLAEEERRRRDRREWEEGREGPGREGLGREALGRERREPGREGLGREGTGQPRDWDREQDREPE